MKGALFLSYNTSCYYLILYIFFIIYSDNKESNKTSDDNGNLESEFLSSLSEDYFITDDESNEDNGSFVAISLPPTPFAYDPYDS